MSNAQAEFIKISNGYNAFCKGKYQRQLWRDFSLQEIAHYPALREAVLNWALKEYQLSTARVCEIKSWLKACYGEHLKPSRELQVLEKDLVVIANALSSEQLVVIPNGKIYVIFGIEPNHKLFNSAMKINSDKLRHVSMPIVRLAFSGSILEDEIENVQVKNFLDAMIGYFRPIGLLLTSTKLAAKNMYVFYEDRFFESLASTLQGTFNSTVDILVSSANITTTGANTTAKGVIQDFCYSDFIVGVVDEGDLNLETNADKNKSTTIVECAHNGVLSYFRIGYPPKHELDDFAERHGLQIAALPTTRESKSR